MSNSLPKASTRPVYVYPVQHSQRRSKRRPRNLASSWLVFVVVAGALLFVLGYGLKIVTEPRSHLEYFNQAVVILSEYTDTMEEIGLIPPADRFAFAASAERVLGGPRAVQGYLAIGDYGLADARLASMRRDLKELRAYENER